jgi:hypothetical protein
MAVATTDTLAKKSARFGTARLKRQIAYVRRLLSPGYGKNAIISKR